MSGRWCKDELKAFDKPVRKLSLELKACNISACFSANENYCRHDMVKEHKLRI